MVFYMIVDLSTHSNMEQHEHPGLITISVVIGEIAIATHTAQRETFLGIISTDVTNLGAQTTSQFAWLLSIYILFWNKATQNFIIKDTSPSQFKMVEFEKHTVILHKMRSKVQKEKISSVTETSSNCDTHICPSGAYVDPVIENSWRVQLESTTLSAMNIWRGEKTNTRRGSMVSELIQSAE